MSDEYVPDVAARLRMRAAEDSTTQGDARLMQEAANEIAMLRDAFADFKRR